MYKTNKNKNKCVDTLRNTQNSGMTWIQQTEITRANKECFYLYCLRKKFFLIWPFLRKATWRTCLWTCSALPTDDQTWSRTCSLPPHNRLLIFASLALWQSSCALTGEHSREHVGHLHRRPSMFSSALGSPGPTRRAEHVRRLECSYTPHTGEDVHRQHPHVHAPMNRELNSHKACSSQAV